MKINDGGQIENMTGKLESIKIAAQKDSRFFELWLNEDSLSYLNMSELLDLKKEITVAIREMTQ